MANIAYVRVSSIEQNEARQIEGLERYAIDEWFVEKVSAKDINRPKLKELLKFTRKGDIVYVHDFSRLARSTRDLLHIIDILKEKSVELVSSKECIDTSTSSGKMMLTMIAAINEFERENLLERQKEGIYIAKRQGKYKGRKRVVLPDRWEEVYGHYKNRMITAKKAMELLGLKKNTFYNFTREQKIKDAGVII